MSGAGVGEMNMRRGGLGIILDLDILELVEKERG